MESIQPFSFHPDLQSLKVSLSPYLEGADTIVVLCDSNTVEYCYPMLADMPMLENAPLIEIDPGESSKCLEISEHIWKEFLDLGVSRRSVLLNLGGGVVCELGGFCASTFKRGMPFIHIPTSLLAMTDAAIGGKTAIDLGFVKNVIGTFALPVDTLVCPVFLESLPMEEMVDGFSETIKHALIADPAFWLDIAAKWSPQNANHLNPQWILQSAQIKREIVQLDPQEKHLRAILNFGHTIGHAIESAFLEHQDFISHGRAIAMGMQAEMRLAVIAGQCPEEEMAPAIQLIGSWFDPVWPEWMSTDRLMEFIRQDKKNSHGVIKMPLLQRIGSNPVMTEVDPDLVVKTLREFIS